jgi:phosphodiester glycosidase
MRSPRIRLALTLIASLVVLAVLSPTPSRATGPTRVVEYGPQSLGPGMTFTRYKQTGIESLATDTKIRRPMVIEIDPSTSATIDVAMPNASLPGNKLLSGMVPLHTTPGPPATTAVAGINGDFGLNGRPFHALMQDGYLWQSGVDIDENFAIRQNERQSFIGRPHVSVDVLDQTGTTLLFPVDRWNSTQEAFTTPPQPGEIDGYSPEGGSIENPPTNSCSARLVNPTPLAWTGQRKAITRQYTVNKVKCTTSPDILPENGGVVVSAPKGTGSKVALIKALTVGQVVTLKTALGWNGVADTIGGDPQILDDGVITQAAMDTRCNSTITVGCQNPRTAVGINQACADGAAGCRIWFVAVDGRQGSWSAGLKLTDLANFMLYLGAYDVLNLDGGGSTGMWIKKDRIPGRSGQLNGASPCQTVSNALNPSYGCFVNRPSTNGSDIVERLLESGVVLLDGADTYPKPESILPP